MTTDVYTHGHHESVLRSHSWRTAANSAAHLLPHLREGQQLLDVGCGPGTITVDLAAHVAPGHVIGVDTSAEVLERARRHAAELGAPVSFQLGDVYALDFPDASFDVVHALGRPRGLAAPLPRGDRRQPRRGRCRPTAGTTSSRRSRPPATPPLPRAGSPAGSPAAPPPDRSGAGAPGGRARRRSSRPGSPARTRRPPGRRPGRPARRHSAERAPAPRPRGRP